MESSLGGAGGQIGQLTVRLGGRATIVNSLFSRQLTMASGRWALTLGPVRNARAVLLATIFSAMLLVSACAGQTPAAGLEVFITTCDLWAGKDFDAIRAVVSQGTGTPTSPWNQLFDATKFVPLPITLPTTLAIRPGASPDQDALIEISALLKGVPVVARTFRTKIPSDHVDTRWIFLTADCANKTCPQEETCEPQTVTCVPVAAPPGGTPNACKLPDAGAGASAGASSGAPGGSGAATGSVGSGSAAGGSAGSSSTASEAGTGGEDGGDGGINAPSPPSCAPGGPGMNDCRPGDGGTESCCTSLPVPGGMFYRHFPNDGTGATTEADPATVSAFRLDKYPVTVGRFRQFVSAWNGGWKPSAGSGRHMHLHAGQGLVDVGAPPGTMTYETGWLTSDSAYIAVDDGSLECTGDATWTPAAGSQENLPMNCISWAEAQAFCIWDQGFLPSEAEWAYAAAGGTDEREYPWGSKDPGTACQYAIYGCYYPPPNPTRTCTGPVNYAPVGTTTLGVGKWGQFDLEGEVQEWVLDWFNLSYVDPCVDCALLTAPAGSSPVSRVYRGGPLNAGAGYLMAGQRSSWDPYLVTDGPEEIGIRCARTP
jgi:formylglycine-generating enzyme required for sulfatase activity